MSIPAIPVTHFQRCVHLAVARNAIFVPPYDANSPLYIRPIVFGSSGHLALTRPSEFRFCVFVQPINAYHGDKPVDALILEEFDRAAPNGVGHAKVGGNYAPVMRWSEKANKDGYGITLHLDSKTRSEIEEFSTSGFIGVLQAGDDKYTLVVPDSRNVISSVTSNSCVEMARRLGWDCEVRPVSTAETPLLHSTSSSYNSSIFRIDHHLTLVCRSSMKSWAAFPKSLLWAPQPGSFPSAR